MVLRALVAVDLELRVEAVVGRDGDRVATVSPDDVKVDLDAFLSGFDEGSS